MGMRYLFSTALLFSACFIATAQPPTKVDRESRADIYVDDYPSTASAQGSAIARRRYASTPSMQRERRLSQETAGATSARPLRADLLRDGDQFNYNTGVYAMPDAYDYDTEEWTDAWGQPVGTYRWSYNEQGELIGIDRFRRGMQQPDLSYRYRYPSTGTAVEEQIMPDGSNRFVREMTLDDLQATQGPGNQPFLDNRAINENYQNSNSTPSRPSSPGGSSTTPSSPY